MNKKEASGIARVNDKITPFLNSPVSPSEFRQSLGNMEASATPVKIILGSSSMPRRKILAEMGYEFSVMAADIDEKSIRKEKPEDLVMAIAEAKAEAILNRLPIGDYIKEAEPTILITGDQIQFHEIPDEVIEKLIEEGIVLNVAGGLIIEHSLILPYVKQVVGAMDSVMGLPKAVTEKLIKEAL
ncbi:maf-like protein DDB_G0281937 isoform X5 [Citrus clementina]|uniref:maf-like protein DDB_G0281937 isoform X5 n=1 Tax=Citrus clementina TaxID=85681 RepID=UPI000CECFC9D|nr:maf-like protein DDB_G0281937 isoform X5 [Citrus x clementina]